MNPYLPYRPYRPYLAGAAAGDSPIVPLFQDDLTDLAIDASGTFTRASAVYHEQYSAFYQPIAANIPLFSGASRKSADWNKSYIGNELKTAEYATDATADFFGIAGAVLPAGKVTKALVWNQTGAAGKQFYFYVLRPTAPNAFTVVFRSAQFTVPASPLGIVEYSTDVTVQDGDKIGWYGNGIPLDIAITGSDGFLAAVAAAPVVNDVITPGTGYPVYFSQARTYRMGVTLEQDRSTLGLLLGPVDTNQITNSANLTITGWTGSNITGAFTTPGLDGFGTRLTATANNATLLRASALTQASGTHATTWPMRRIAGTGTVALTLDGGTTWQDVTSQVGVTYKRISVDAVVANPKIGLRFGTLGDIVDVGNVECRYNTTKEVATASSPIKTTTAAVSKAVDALSYSGAFPVNNATEIATSNGTVNITNWDGGVPEFTEPTVVYSVTVNPNGATTPVPLFYDDLTDLLIKNTGTPTRGSTAYHQQPDGTWASIASGAPRFYGARWTGSAWSLLDALGDPLPGPFGYLMEPVETNYCKGTADYSGVSWANFSNGDMVAAAPVNGLPCGRLQPAANVAATPIVYQVGISALAASQPIAITAKVKADGYDALYLRVDTNDQTDQAIFNLATGTSPAQGTDVDSRVITALSGVWAGWYQITVFCTTDDTSQDMAIGFGPKESISVVAFSTYTGDTTKGILITDARIYSGTSVPTTSPVLTTTAAGVRAVDALSYTDPVADNESRIVKRLVSDPGTEIVVDIDDWGYSMPVPTVPTIIQSVTVYAPGERPA